MAVPMTSGSHPDLLDTRFREILMRWTVPPDAMLGEFYTVRTTTKADERQSQMEPFGRPSEFGTTSNQSITYQSQSQGYDVIATPREFAGGFQLQRKLMRDDQYGATERLPTLLRDSFQDLEEHNASRVFRLAFQSDSYFYNQSEGVALCSNSHTTNSGTSTATGFDNLVTTALSAVNLVTMRILMSKFRNPASLRMGGISPDTILIPPDLYATAYEIIAAAGKVDTSNNNPNVHQGQYRLLQWDYLTGDDNSETNNYFLIDSRRMKQALTWWNRESFEMEMFNDFDTMVMKERGYVRYGCDFNDWRWVVGAQVS